MANEMGLGVVPFSPLSNGLLSGKYSIEDFRNKSGSTGFQGSRKTALETLGKFTERNMEIVDEVKKVASEVQKSPAQVALAWLLSKSTVTSVLLGASKLEQLENNFRPPDIGSGKNVRFEPRSRCWGTNRGSAALDRRSGKGKPDAPRWAHFKAHPQARAGEDGGRFIEDLTERLGGVGAVR